MSDPNPLGPQFEPTEWDLMMEPTPEDPVDGLPTTFVGEVPEAVENPTEWDEISQKYKEGILDTFTGLLDAPDSYEGMAAKLVAVNTAGTGLDFVAGGGGGSLPQPLDTTDTPTFSGINVAAVSLSTAGTAPAYHEGGVYWSPDDRALTVQVGLDDVALQVGQEEFIQVRNATAAPIPNGTVVMYDGAVGNIGRIKAKPMVADGTYPGMVLLGVTTHAIEAGTDGMVTNFGKVRGIDTSGLEEGDILWANPDIPGGLTVTQPQAPNLKLPIAVVVSPANNGTIFVRATPGTSLGNDDQVELVDPVDGEVLTYNGTTGRWENQAPSALPQPLDTTDAPRFARLGLGEAADGTLALVAGASATGRLARIGADATGTHLSTYSEGSILSSGGYYDGSAYQSTGAQAGHLLLASGGLGVMTAGDLTPGQAHTPTLRFSVDVRGNVVLGSGGLATNAADGFLRITSCPGTPTQAPTGATGRIPLVYDSTGNVLYAYSNASWRRVDGLPINAKGDILVHTGTSRARLPVGNNGQVLVADSAQTNGMAWKAAPGAWSADNMTILTRGAMQSLLSWESPYDATRTNVIEWDVETHDGLGVWSAEAPKLITIAASGWYSIAAHLPVVMNSWSRACVLLNQDNFGSGTGYLESIIECIPTGSSADPKVHRVIIPAVQLSAGDVLRVVVVGYAAGNTGTGAEHCKLWLQRLA